MKGMLWVKNKSIHYLDNNNDEWKYTGENKGETGGTSGSIWIENNRFHYIDEGGIKRECVNNILSNTTGIEGSVWIENNYIHFLTDNGYKAEVNKDWNDHNDTGYSDDQAVARHINREESYYRTIGYTDHLDDHSDNMHEDYIDGGPPNSRWPKKVWAQHMSYDTTYKDHSDSHLDEGTGHINEHLDNMHEDYIDGAPPNSRYPKKVWAQHMNYDTKYEDHSDSHTDEASRSRTRFIDRHENTTRYSHGDNWEDWSDWVDHPVRVY